MRLSVLPLMSIDSRLWNELYTGAYFIPSFLAISVILLKERGCLHSINNDECYEQSATKKRLESKLQVVFCFCLWRLQTKTHLQQSPGLPTNRTLLSNCTGVFIGFRLPFCTEAFVSRLSFQGFRFKVFVSTSVNYSTLFSEKCSRCLTYNYWICIHLTILQMKIYQLISTNQ